MTPRWQRALAGILASAFLVWLLRTGTLYRPDVWQVWWAIKWLPVAFALGLPGGLVALLPERVAFGLWAVYLSPIPHALGAPWWALVFGVGALTGWRKIKEPVWAHVAGFLVGVYLALHVKLSLDLLI